MSTITTDPAPPIRLAQILVVEDNPGDAILLKEALSALKIANSVSIATDGEQALHMLRQREPYTDHPKPDLVMLDLNLPRIDGREVLETIKTDAALLDIPVIVLSGSPALWDIDKTMGAKADGYVMKPIDLDSLRNIVAVVEHFGLSVVVLPQATEATEATESVHGQ